MRLATRQPTLNSLREFVNVPRQTGNGREGQLSPERTGKVSSSGAGNFASKPPLVVLDDNFGSIIREETIPSNYRKFIKSSACKRRKLSPAGDGQVGYPDFV